MALTGSSFLLLTKWVAPTRLAISSFDSNISTPMICRAPPMRAPWTIASPTPPQPNTATVCPARSPEDRRAHAGEHAAAHQRRAVERQRGIDLHDRVLVQQHALGVAADADELPEPL